ncbi:hypothetical protein Prudu_290S000300, partial [Prunus dulcis]
LSRDTLSPQSLSLSPTPALSLLGSSVPATAGPETGPVRLASPSRQALPVFPVGNQELRPRARLVRTGTVPPSRRRLRRPNSVIEVE